jgi:hypothetical protein
VTVSVPVVFRDLGSPSGPGSATLSGTTAALAEAFNEFAALGVSHLMIDVSPHTLEAVERLSKVCVR